LVRTLVFDGVSPADLRVVERWTAGVLARIERLTSPSRRT
jgi:hypothetical protein